MGRAKNLRGAPAKLGELENLRIGQGLSIAGLCLHCHGAPAALPMNGHGLGPQRLAEDTPAGCIHPVVIGSGDPSVSGSFSMTPAMGLTFGISLVAFSILFACLLWHRIRLGQLAQRVEQLRMHVSE